MRVEDLTKFEEECPTIVVLFEDSNCRLIKL